MSVTRALSRSLLAATILTAAACQPLPTPPPPMPAEPRTQAYLEQHFPDYHVEFRWNSEPGIDLQSPEIRFLRAFEESKEIYARTLDVSVTYPGFEIPFIGRLQTIYKDSSPFPGWSSTYWARIYEISRRDSEVSFRWCGKYDPRRTYDKGEFVSEKNTGWYSSITLDLSHVDPQDKGAASAPLARPSTDQFRGITIQAYEPAEPRTPCGEKLDHDMATQPPTFSPGWPAVQATQVPIGPARGR